uniref:Uncharacterized protein n=1 Tax=Physcomitrium patens TaxID=3218 RepID=A0A2K1JIY9_PHYPA|nr:hypothetical protein PHYPA_018915 [Physcomitrium patens]
MRVYQCPTEATNSLLVSVLNKGRDAIYDDKMSWEPFVDQTTYMIRSCIEARPNELKCKSFLHSMIYT